MRLVVEANRSGWRSRGCGRLAHPQLVASTQLLVVLTQQIVALTQLTVASPTLKKLSKKSAASGTVFYGFLFPNYFLGFLRVLQTFLCPDLDPTFQNGRILTLA
jgi:hypothetical protein